MQNKKLLAALCGLCILSAGLVAETKYPKPGRTDVVIVTRVIMSPAVDEAFFARYLPLKEASVYVDMDKEQLAKFNSYIYLDFTTTKNKTYETFMGEVKDFGTSKIDLPKDRIISFSDFSYYLGGHPQLFFYLPVYADLVIPEGAKYVYPGSFVYKWTGNQFDIAGVDVIDEFDAAQKIVKERYGADAELVRAPMREHKKDVKK